MAAIFVFSVTPSRPRPEEPREARPLEGRSKRAPTRLRTGPSFERLDCRGMLSRIAPQDEAVDFAPAVDRIILGVTFFGETRNRGRFPGAWLRWAPGWRGLRGLGCGGRE